MGVKKYSKGELPPCPDTDRFILVKTKEGYYWRRKRGTIKPATLNKVLQRNNATARLTGPAASRLLGVLEEHTRSLEKGNIHLVMAGLLMRSYHEKGEMDYSLFRGLDLNKRAPLDSIFLDVYNVSEDDHRLHIQLSIAPGTVKQQNNLVTEYFFEAILVSGSPAKARGLQTDSDSSPLFSFFDPRPKECELSLPKPEPGTPWMLLLKLSCLEENEMAAAARHYAMKVVRVSG